MYAVTSCLFDSLTLATFRRAEFGFLGVIVLTTVQTPRLKGELIFSIARSLALKNLPNAETRVFLALGRRPFLISWLIVGIKLLLHPRPVGRRRDQTPDYNIFL